MCSITRFQSRDAFSSTRCAAWRTSDRRLMQRSALVRRCELHYHLVPSNPQIAGGNNIDALLTERTSAETGMLTRSRDAPGSE